MLYDCGLITTTQGVVMLIGENTFGKYREIDAPDEHLFLGVCLGIALVPRGSNDNHICFKLLAEDDGNWGVLSSWPSSFWLSDLQNELVAAQKWMEDNAEKEKFGYRFK